MMSPATEVGEGENEHDVLLESGLACNAPGGLCNYHHLMELTPRTFHSLFRFPVITDPANNIMVEDVICVLCGG